MSLICSHEKDVSFETNLSGKFTLILLNRVWWWRGEWDSQHERLV